MKLNLQLNPDLNLISGYGSDHLMINKVRHEGNLVVTTREVVPGWAPAGFDGLGVADIEALCRLSAEVVLLGTGAHQRFPAPQLMRPLFEARIGFEVMSLPAACRTYNILASEGRAVALAALFDRT